VVYILLYSYSSWIYYGCCVCSFFCLPVARPCPALSSSSSVSGSHGMELWTENATMMLDMCSGLVFQWNVPIVGMFPPAWSFVLLCSWLWLLTERFSSCWQSQTWHLRKGSRSQSRKLVKCNPIHGFSTNESTSHNVKHVLARMWGRTISALNNNYMTWSCDDNIMMAR